MAQAPLRTLPSGLRESGFAASGEAVEVPMMMPEAVEASGEGVEVLMGEMMPTAVDAGAAYVSQAINHPACGAHVPLDPCCSDQQLGALSADYHPGGRACVQPEVLTLEQQELIARNHEKAKLRKRQAQASRKQQSTVGVTMEETMPKAVEASGDPVEVPMEASGEEAKDEAAEPPKKRRQLDQLLDPAKVNTPHKLKEVLSPQVLADLEDQDMSSTLETSMLLSLSDNSNIHLIQDAVIAKLPDGKKVFEGDVLSSYIAFKTMSYYIRAHLCITTYVMTDMVISFHILYSVNLYIYT